MKTVTKKKAKENLWKYTNFLKYNIEELMVLSALDGLIFGPYLAISLTSC